MWQGKTYSTLTLFLTFDQRFAPFHTTRVKNLAPFLHSIEIQNKKDMGSKKHRKGNTNSALPLKDGFARLLTPAERDRIMNALTSYGPISTTLALQQFMQSIGEPASDEVLMDLFKQLLEVEQTKLKLNAQHQGGSNSTAAAAAAARASYVLSPPVADSNEISMLSNGNASLPPPEPVTLRSLSASFFSPNIGSDVVLEMFGMLKQKANINAAMQDDTKEVFEALCVEDNSGQSAVNAEQVRSVAATFRLNVDVDAILKKYDTDGSGMLDLSEFRKIFDQDEDAKRAAMVVLARKFKHPVHDVNERSPSSLNQEEEDLSMFLERGCPEDLNARRAIAELRAVNQRRDEQRRKFMRGAISPSVLANSPDRGGGGGGVGPHMTSEDKSGVIGGGGNSAAINMKDRSSSAYDEHARQIIRDPELWIGSGMAVATASSIEEQLQSAQHHLEKDPLRSVRKMPQAYHNGNAGPIEPRLLRSTQSSLPPINSGRKQQQQQQQAGTSTTPRGGKPLNTSLEMGSVSAQKGNVVLPAISSPRTVRQR